MRMPGTEWRPSPNFSHPVNRPARGAVLHTADGTYEGTISWQLNPVSQVSSFFVTAKDGRIAQCVDTDNKAWTQGTGNEDWIGIENEGNSDALTDPQLSAVARIYAWLVQVYGVPIVSTDDPVNGRGLGWHGMGSSIGWGHPFCPGEPIKGQRGEILRRTALILGHGPGPAPQPSEALLTTVATGQRNPNGRTPTARPVPALGVVLLENGARVVGDKPNGKSRTWLPPAPAGGTLIDIAAVDDPKHPFVALVGYPSGDTLTYECTLP